VIEIELDIYSGVPNPRWTLSPSEERSLLTQIADRVVPVVADSMVPSRLGYLGFVVHASGESAAALARSGLPPRVRIFGEAAAQHSTSDIEAELAEEARNFGTESFGARSMYEAVQSTSPTPVVAAACNLQGTSWNDFSFWNSVQAVRLSNNCYNYAANDRTDNFAQPGYRSGTGYGSFYPANPYPAPTVTNIHNGALGDGLKDTCSGDMLRVCFVIDPGYDYHWYRLNKNSSGANRWCHKRGTTYAQNKDNQGNYITNVEALTSAENFGYSVFGKYMFVNSPQGNVKGWS
jgi:hypothetical protein